PSIPRMSCWTPSACLTSRHMPTPNECWPPWHWTRRHGVARSRGSCRDASDTPKLGTPCPRRWFAASSRGRRSEEHTSELQSRGHLVCRLLLEKKNQKHQS